MTYEEIALELVKLSLLQSDEDKNMPAELYF
jgi:hypothetical protein